MFYVIIGLDPIIYFIILQSFIDCRVKHGNDIFFRDCLKKKQWELLDLETRKKVEEITKEIEEIDKKNKIERERKKAFKGDF